MTIAFDRDALEAYIKLNPSLETVDDFLMLLIADGFISEDNLRQCTITVSLLFSGDMYLALKANTNSDSPCARFAEEIVRRINDPPRNDSSGTAVASTPNPQVQCIVAKKKTSA